MSKAHSIAGLTTQAQKVGDHEKAALLIRAGLSIQDALEEASIHLCSVIEIVRDAAMLNESPVALHGAVTLAEIAKALIDAADVALICGKQDEVSNG